MKTVPSKVKAITEAHLDLLHSTLPDRVEGYYLNGSTALGAYNDGLSDIDFIAVMRRTLTEADQNALLQVHRQLQRRFSATFLDGSYIVKEDLEHLNHKAAPCLRFNEGKFRGIESLDKDSIDVYQFITYGIPLRGPEPSAYQIEIDWDRLLAEMKTNLNTYWVNWRNRCAKFPSLSYLALYVSLSGIEWGVLGVTRLYYTFRERDIISKIGAGEYALRTLPERWHRIVKEAMRQRHKITKSYYRSLIERRKDALAYIDYIIQSCNKRM
ncbi:aminoglycoside adenylyltransferase domain-containing protein [Paenibacillus sp. J2TS4]|uniref:aminoglycoside adenylyltransferase domain-containing protein n=1 Tax=Paenibacillus sp. J2TS4 TaxID=2807194 RepID=UPI001B1546F9|nr:aminoglycoside adenylyltransferase domain-containing protein [Paenibacillus sp. J2TS4]GIP31832.1 hypothetical protein J2TS4_10420 [Paenibacillus sp. J2TS4]